MPILPVKNSETKPIRKKTNYVKLTGYAAVGSGVFSAIAANKNKVKLHKQLAYLTGIFAALHMLRVLSYHAKCREQNQGAFYYMTDYHLDMFFGAYKRLSMLANDQADLNII